MYYLLLTVAIYALPPPPLRPIEGVRGIHPFYHPNTENKSGMCVCVCVSRYLLYLGPNH
jgi:hypothetical protein